MVTPPRARTAATMRAISSAAIEVPVGLLGLASNTPRVAVFQWASTCAALSCHRLWASAGTSTACASVAATKWRLQG
jgi:hypothetical protein